MNGSQRQLQRSVVITVFNILMLGQLGPTWECKHGLCWLVYLLSTLLPFIKKELTRLFYRRACSLFAVTAARDYSSSHPYRRLLSTNLTLKPLQWPESDWKTRLWKKGRAKGMILEGACAFLTYLMSEVLVGVWKQGRYSQVQQA